MAQALWGKALWGAADRQLAEAAEDGWAAVWPRVRADTVCAQAAVKKWCINREYRAVPWRVRSAAREWSEGNDEAVLLTAEFVRIRYSGR